MAEAPQVSVIIPTINEAENLPLLLPQIAQALAGKTYEVIVVDDASTDNTRSVCQELSGQFPLRLITRHGATDGLSGAVLLGMKEATGGTFVVMDADLQHPPQRIPALLAELEDGADFALGSRYVPGGGTSASWTIFRKLNSAAATFLARPFAGKVRDPMSGFFALRRQTYQSATRLTPLGYKIALELMCKCRVRSVREVPIHFDLRRHGQSKLTLKQQFRYLEHLSRLYDFCYPRASPVIKFLIVLAVSWAAGGGLLAALLHSAWQIPIAAPLAYLAAIAVTSIFHLRYIHTQHEFIIRPHPWLDFTIISAAELATCSLTALWIEHRLAAPTLAETFFLTFGAATVVRYVLRKEFLQDIRGLRKELRPES